MCGDSVDVVGGRAVGSVRVSLGWQSDVGDVRVLLSLLYDSFLRQPTLSWPALMELLLQATKEEALSPPELPPPSARVVVKKGGRGEGAGKEEEGEGEKEKRTPSLRRLWLYPLKSGRAVASREWGIGERGLAYDRAWMVLDGRGLAVNQKRCRRLALVQPSVGETQLKLSADGFPSFSLPLDPNAAPGASQRANVCSDKFDHSEQ